MDLIRKLYVKADGFARGQTLAEYVADRRGGGRCGRIAGYHIHGHYHQRAG